MELSLGLAFVAGTISFASPCVLALVPVYLAYLGETAASTPAYATAMGRGEARAGTQPLIGQAALFCAAFGTVFILIGISVGLVGSPLFRLPLVREAAGVAVIGLGLLMTGLFGSALARVSLRPPVDRLPRARSARSLALGALFAVGWSPCIGPVLGAILTMGASAQHVGVAALLLGGYSAGLALPFLAVALALPQLTPLVALLRRRHRLIEMIAGLFVIIMGVLILTNAFGRMASLFTFVL